MVTIRRRREGERSGKANRQHKQAQTESCVEVKVRAGTRASMISITGRQTDTHRNTLSQTANWLEAV